MSTARCPRVGTTDWRLPSTGAARPDTAVYEAGSEPASCRMRYARLHLRAVWRLPCRGHCVEVHMAPCHVLKETIMSLRFTAPLLLAAGLTLGAPAAFAAPQPAMMHALRDLQHARAELAHAAPDKGGWRVHAMQQIDQAIASVRAGMRYSNQH